VPLDAAPLLLQAPARFLGFEMVSPSGGLRRDRRVEPGTGTATLHAASLRFRGTRLDQEVTIPTDHIHAVALATSHNGRRWWSGKVLKVSFGGGDTRVLGLHLSSADATEWHRLLGQLIAG